MAGNDWKTGVSKNSSASPSSDKPIAPYGSYVFALSITKEGDGDEEIAHFMECSGLKTTSEVFEVVEGGLNSRVHKLPGQSRWENITLRYATSSSVTLFEWRDQFLQDNFGERTKYSGEIKMMDNDFEVIRRFKFKNAWPVSWEGPSLNSGGSEIAIESLELAHDGIYLE
jgi:phage tail-like protein